MAGATHNDIAGNFTLDGANLATKHLTGAVGGDLIIKSRQDTYQYDSKQQNIGGSADIDFSGKLQNANINSGKQQLNAQYAQVTNQSGIIAKYIKPKLTRTRQVYRWLSLVGVIGFNQSGGIAMDSTGRFCAVTSGCMQFGPRFGSSTYIDANVTKNAYTRNFNQKCCHNWWCCTYTGR